MTRPKKTDSEMVSIEPNKPRRSRIMCYNCGCEMPDNDMGNPKNVTDKTFEEAAKASSQSPEEAKRNTFELLKKIFKEG